MSKFALILLATLRLTRFVTSDHLGHWWLVQPARRWALESSRYGHFGDHEADDLWEEAANLPDPPAPVKLVKGLDCPFCVGFWLGALILLGDTIVGKSPLRPLWALGLATFSLNYVVGHISARIDS